MPPPLPPPPSRDRDDRDEDEGCDLKKSPLLTDDDEYEDAAGTPLLIDDDDDEDAAGTSYMTNWMSALLQKSAAFMLRTIGSLHTTHRVRSRYMVLMLNVTSGLASSNDGAASASSPSL